MTDDTPALGGAGRAGVGPRAEDGRDSEAEKDRIASGEGVRVPRWLQTGAAWSWRLLILAAAIYLVARVLSLLSIVVVPCIVALLLTALLQPLTARLRRAGLPPLAATWVTLLIVAVVFGGLVMLIAARVALPPQEQQRPAVPE